MNGNGTARLQVRHLVSAFLRFAAFNWREQIPEEATEAWVEELADLPLGRLETALKRARRQKFMPNVGDVREIAAGLEAAAGSLALGQQSRALLERGAKPPDWEPLAPNEQAALFDKFKSKVTVIAEAKRMPEPTESLDERMAKLRKQAEELQRRPPQSGGEV